MAAVFFGVTGKHRKKKRCIPVCTLQPAYHSVQRNTKQKCTVYMTIHGTKYFRQKVGTSFTAYVNDYRISEVCCRLDDTDDSILKISADCGFASLRTMNRNFLRQTGITPAEYRKRKTACEIKA